MFCHQHINNIERERTFQKIREMMRTPCCENMGLKKGPWTPDEDEILISHVQQFGHDNWRALPMQAGIQRCGKSCRLRWTNYLRPDIKRGNFSVEEEETITKLHALIGNRWSAIAAKLPGRTDNEIKNFWHTRIKKKRGKTPAFQHNVESYVETTPAEVSNHMRSSLSNAEVSSHMRSSLSNAEVSNHMSSKSSSYNYNNINVMQSSSLTTEIQGITDCRNQFLSPEGTRKEAMDDNNSIVNNDMVFWYDLLMKSGDTQNE